MIDYKSVSLANQVFEAIERNILNGVYAPGEVLSENRLSKELGVSRTPIREALSRLEGEKLISSSPMGSVVLGITKKDVEDMFFVKKSLEPEAFRRAAENMSNEALEKTKAIYEESGSPILFSVLSQNHHKLLKFRKASLEKSNRIPGAFREHVAIYEALAERDGEKVARLMMEHVIHAYENQR